MRTFIVLTISAILPLSAMAAVLLDAPVFHGATRSRLYEEKWPEDTGGVLYLFLLNDGPEADAVAEVLIGGMPLSSHETVSWWRAWPRELAPGQAGWVTIKATGAPLEQGTSAEVAVRMRSGKALTRSVQLDTPPLRLANVLPAPDHRTLIIYLRNDGAAPLTLDRLQVNEQDYAVDAAALEIVGGDPILPPGGLRILTLRMEAPLPILHPLAVRARALDGSAPVWTGAGIRLTEPHFPIGTWESGMPEREEGQQYARRVGIDVCVATRSVELQQEMHRKYHIRTLRLGNIETGDPPRKQPDVEAVRALADSPHVAAWMVRDEPDLHNIPARLMHEHNDQYWDNTPNHPTYLNLMTMAGFNDYGHIPDIVCMDHYVMFAPNNIPRTGITRHARMEEAIEFTDLLKDNTEPVRMWIWPQLAAPVWSRQPHPWGVNYQFWAHVMGGAKGLLWFKYGAGYEHDERYAEQTAEAERLIRQLNPVRSLCFYGEPLRNFETDNEKLVGRTLVSGDAVLAIVLNNNYEVSGVPFSSAYTLHPASGRVTVPIPHWIPVEQVLRVNPEGVEPADHEQVSGAAHIPVALEQDSHVYLIGRRDATPPERVTGLNIAAVNETEAVLSWAVPFDNYGVHGYQVYRNNALAAETRHPIHTVGATPGNAGTYTVSAVDAAGNEGPPSEAVTLAL